MSVHLSKLAIIAFSVVTVSGCNEAADDADEAMEEPGIEGAWHLAEFKVGDAAPVSNPASIYVFTSSHYSVAYSSVAGPRPQFADRSAPTDAEKMSAYDTFVANSGTYTVVGDTLVIRPIVARNPNYMGGGEDKFVMRASGDTLWLNNVVGAFKFADGQGSANSSNDSYTLIRAR